jgi:hypothetical protein
MSLRPRHGPLLRQAFAAMVPDVGVDRGVPHSSSSKEQLDAFPHCAMTTRALQDDVAHGLDLGHCVGHGDGDRCAL